MSIQRRSRSFTEGPTALAFFTDRQHACRRFAAYLDAETPLLIILFFYGDGGNGKSLLLHFAVAVRHIGALRSSDAALRSSDAALRSSDAALRPSDAALRLSDAAFRSSDALQMRNTGRRGLSRVCCLRSSWYCDAIGAGEGKR